MPSQDLHNLSIKRRVEIPCEILLKIMSHTDPSSLLGLRLVCRVWNEVIKNPFLWRKLNSACGIVDDFYLNCLEFPRITKILVRNHRIQESLFCYRDDKWRKSPALSPDLSSFERQTFDVMLRVDQRNFICLSLLESRFILLHQGQEYFQQPANRLLSPILAYHLIRFDKLGSSFGKQKPYLLLLTRQCMNLYQIGTSIILIQKIALPSTLLHEDRSRGRIQTFIASSSENDDNSGSRNLLLISFGDNKCFRYRMRFGEDGLLQMDLPSEVIKTSIMLESGNSTSMGKNDKTSFIMIDKCVGDVVIAQMSRDETTLITRKLQKLTGIRCKATRAALCNTPCSGRFAGTAIVGYDDGRLCIHQNVYGDPSIGDTIRASSASITTINCDWNRGIVLAGSFDGQLRVYRVHSSDLRSRLKLCHTIDFESPIISVELTVPQVESHQSEHREDASMQIVNLAVACYGGKISTQAFQPDRGSLVSTSPTSSCRREIDYDVNIVRKWIQCLDF